MRSFKQYITEIGDSPYPWHFLGSDNDEEYHDYHISHPTNPKKDIKVEITHEYYPSKSGKHGAEVSFRRANNPGLYAYHQTNDMTTGESVKVFSTIRDILAHHVKKNPNVTHFTFTANKQEEPKRVNLYTKFTKTLGGVINRENEDEEWRPYTEFKIPADKL